MGHSLWPVFFFFLLIADKWLLSSSFVFCGNVEFVAVPPPPIYARTNFIPGILMCQGECVCLFVIVEIANLSFGTC